MKRLRNRALVYCSIVQFTGFVLTPVCLASYSQEARFRATHRNTGKILGIETAINPRMARSGRRRTLPYHVRNPYSGRFAWSGTRRRHRVHWLEACGPNSIRETHGYTKQSFTHSPSERANYDPTLVATKNLKQNDVPHVIHREPAAVQVTPSDPTPFEEETPTQNLPELAALEYLKEANLDASWDLLHDAESHSDDGETAHFLAMKIDELRADAAQHGGIAIQADTQEATVSIDGQRLDIRVPCIALTSSGVHAVEVEQPGGKRLSFIVEVWNKQKSSVTVDFEHNTWNVDGNGNRWFSIDAVTMSAGQRELFSLPPISYGERLDIIVYRPEGTSFSYNIYDPHKEKDNVLLKGYNTEHIFATSNGDASEKKLQIECQRGGGEFYVVTTTTGYFPTKMKASPWEDLMQPGFIRK